MVNWRFKFNFLFFCNLFGFCYLYLRILSPNKNYRTRVTPFSKTTEMNFVIKRTFF